MVFKKRYGLRQLVMATSSRKDGPMGFAVDFSASAPLRRRRRFFLSLGIPPERVVSCNQVHGARVALAERARRFLVPKTDALVTDRQNIFLAVRHADCFPVFFYDAGLNVAAIAHSGWRGTALGIAPRVVRALTRRFGVPARNLYAFIGPGIQQCHFAVWPESRHRRIVRLLRSRKKFVKRTPNGIFVDLRGAIRQQLLESGIPAPHIRMSRECTYHEPKKFFSYRRDARLRPPNGFGNMISVIGVRRYEKKAA